MNKIKEKINQEIKKRDVSYLKDADLKPLTEEERERVREYLNKYRPHWIPKKQ